MLNLFWEKMKWGISYGFLNSVQVHPSAKYRTKEQFYSLETWNCFAFWWQYQWYLRPSLKKITRIVFSWLDSRNISNLISWTSRISSSFVGIVKVYKIDSAMHFCGPKAQFLLASHLVVGQGKSHRCIGSHHRSLGGKNANSKSRSISCKKHA